MSCGALTQQAFAFPLTSAHATPRTQILPDQFLQEAARSIGGWSKKQQTTRRARALNRSRKEQQFRIAFALHCITLQYSTPSRSHSLTETASGTLPVLALTLAVAARDAAVQA